MTKIIGIDFDNTIADYSSSFYNIGRQLEFIPKEIEPTKQAVKCFLREQFGPDKWTELQGVVYGKKIGNAVPYVGVKEAITKFIESGFSVFIVSHKTTYPVIGEKVSLHKYALNWLLENEIVGERQNQLPLNNVFFNETQQLKLEKIAELKCDIFIDDLEAIFKHTCFPKNTEKILFTPHSTEQSSSLQFASWDSIVEYVNDI